MSKAEDDMVKLCVSIRDANAMIVEAINAYLTERLQLKSKLRRAKLFPRDLADLLIFEATSEGWEIRPKQYLGSDNFSKIVAIVKQYEENTSQKAKRSNFKPARKKGTKWRQRRNIT